MAEDEILGPEVYLWRRVIEQAITDATASIRSKNEDGRRRAHHARNTARDWLLGNSADFREVCGYALLDSDAVLENAQALSRRHWEVLHPQKLAETV